MFICSSSNAEKHDSSKYFYEMPVEELSEFIDIVNAIKLGSSAENIIAKLGQPKYDTTDYSKEVIAGNRKFLARNLTYYVKLWEDGLVNTQKDQLVSFRFSQENILFEIFSSTPLIKSRK